ncbi:Tcp11-domain-containing protein [Gonapodya prolifera JEL478]|uniref:Tcp11-domain-containing protein n=1 Tax=Gonapodya prolifera (strain JEL478) TaxID=1344416 RepID=A0A139A5G5_GONPJ|nr:Tcp11-domain-containing protein [Gonapodya prolifera JEL478]|eukprot:KXS12057.1 Tcp11-domain-containing protein [Gonapodya prolifera JEL478]
MLKASFPKLIKDLLAFASKLTETFRRLASHQSYSAAFSKDLFEFLAAYDAFYSKFDAWKRRDTDRVIDHLVAHWIDLERLWLSVKDQPHADDMWSEKIDRQQRDIQEKLRKLAGQAGLERLAEARRNAISRTPDDDAVMAESRSPSPSPHSGASSPRVPSTPIGSSSPTNLHTVDDMSSSPKTFPSSLERWAQQRKKDSVTNSRRSSPAPGTAGPSSRERAVPEIHPSEGQEVRDRATSSSPVPDVSSPRASARVNEEFNALFKGFGHGGMSNEALAHEVLLDPDFKLKPPKRTDLEERIHLMTRKAFFDQVRDDFNSKIFGHLLPLIKDIKEGLLSLVSEKGSIHREIDASLDLVLIQQQVSRNSADIKRYILFVIEKMLQLCAPIRDQEIRNLRDVLDADAVGAIEGVLSTLEHMKLDLANYRLTELRPYLAKEAVTYERNKFAFALNRVDVTLERTRQWLNSAAQSLQSVAASRNPEGIEVMPHTAIRFEDVFVEGLMTLVFSRTAVSRETVPETMLLDVERLFAFQNDAQAVTVIASLVMLCKNVVTELRTDETGVKILSKTISVLLDGGAEGVTTDHLGLQVVSSMRSFLQSKGKSLSQEQEGVLKQMVEKTLSYRDAVFNLIARRIQEKVRQQLQTGMFPRQTLVSSGLDCVAEELEKLSRKIYMLGKHNKEVFSPYYDEIIRESLGLLG